jgi:hypothetical protein
MNNHLKSRFSDHNANEQYLHLHECYALSLPVYICNYVCACDTVRSFMYRKRKFIHISGITMNADPGSGS